MTQFEGSYLSLESLTDRLKKLGFERVKMTKAWKRKDHRDCNIQGFFRIDPKLKAKDEMLRVKALLETIDLDVYRAKYTLYKTSYPAWLELYVSALLELPV